MTNVVVVESPAKAKTINKYLGKDFTVLASYGHVRDLPPKDGSVRPDDGFSMDWQVDDRAKQRLDDIAKAVKGADHLYLATDPDREGEAISWHVEEVLRQKKVLDGVDVKRVVFNEITKNAIIEAIENPRELDSDLIEAYLARRALDYLVGFTLSPVLWRKLPGSKSAGRVQSVALRLICEREAEIEVFRPQEYWSIEAVFAKETNEKFTTRLTHLNGEKLDKFGLPNEEAAKAAVDAIEARAFHVANVEKKQVRRHPQPPFTTSTLQQEASRKLRLSATQTMRTAQRLYEGVDIGGETVGLITYMRTDSFTMAGEAIAGARRLIDNDYGKDYLPDSPRAYKTKAKNAQEAHEAIRPTDMWRRPKQMAQYLERDQLALYELIWQRAVACQMESVVLDQVTVDLASGDDTIRLRATGSVIVFDGFYKVYHQARDEDASEPDDEQGKLLPPLKENEAVERREVTPDQHFTQPPPRYTEASLVKKLEELGIGRPSTYASILQVLQDRNYVTLEQRRFTPEDRGRVVTAFLESFFRRYVEYDFTANLENQLDDISGGRIEWKHVLREFWASFSKAIEEASEYRIRDVVDALDEDLGPHFFPTADPQTGEVIEDPRKCPACDDGRLGLRLGKFGAFIGCSNYPECKHTRRLAIAGNGAGNGEVAADKELGKHPEEDKTVWLKDGRFGPYIQLGEVEEIEEETKTGKKKVKKIKPKTVSIPKGKDLAEIDLEFALKLLALPREVGPHPEDGEPIIAGLGRYGPYIKHKSTYKSIEADELFSIGPNRAVALLLEAPKRGGQAALRTLGDHPDDGKPVTVHEGRFGPYIKHGKVNASIPKGSSPDDITLDQALPLLAARLERMAAKKGGAKAKPKKGAKKPAAKKNAAKKKAPAKKAAPKEKAS